MILTVCLTDLLPVKINLMLLAGGLFLALFTQLALIGGWKYKGWAWGQQLWKIKSRNALKMHKKSTWVPWTKSIVTSHLGPEFVKELIGQMLTLNQYIYLMCIKNVKEKKYVIAMLQIHKINTFYSLNSKIADIVI